ncbi:MAG TPA: DUF481 domain-containing protein [Gemmatimonadaceae bacterium]|nr:DUF481 domain-containing protein [Gemmatimonadaceae bacterium]
MKRLRRLLAWSAMLLCAGTLAAPAGAQQLGWNGQADGGASLFFGNTRQWVVTAHTKLAHLDSTLEMRAEGRVGYAQAKTDSGVTVLSSRSWLASFGLDYHPLDRWSPFMSGSVESSFEQRIARRYSAGLGAKYTVAHGDTTSLDISLAVLGERTEASDPSIELGVPASRVRWSWRVRAEHRMGERVKLSHTTLYQPSAQDLSHFTLNTSTVLSIDLTKVLALTFTAEDIYDSEARSRGARTNNDGHLLFGARVRY